MPFDAFISYSHKDKLIADSACALVEAAGVRCWMAPRDIRPGADWSESISEGIDQCRVMVLIFSSNSNESRQVRREVAHAFNEGLTIVPVRLEQVEPNRALAFHIESFHWLDALSEPREQYLRELAQHIKAILETQPEALRERQEQEQRRQEAEHRRGEEEARQAEEARRTEATRQAEAERQRQDAQRRAREEGAARLLEATREAEARRKSDEAGRRSQPISEASDAVSRADSPFGRKPALIGIAIVAAVLVAVLGLILAEVFRTSPSQQASTAPPAPARPASTPTPAPAPTPTPTPTQPTPAVQPAPQPALPMPMPMPILPGLPMPMPMPILPAPTQPAPAAQPATQPAPAAQPAAVQSFRDCPDCPEMVTVPSGQFIMGSEEDHDDDESPRHAVTVNTAFAVGKYDVLRAEYAKFVQATGVNVASNCQTLNSGGKSWRDPGFAQTDRDPVVCVSWKDAKAYVAWLSKTAGKGYRLLTEAEWEYAARAGTTTVRYWGDALGSGNANCSGCGSRWDNEGTSPAGSFAPNPWGLYDMLGDADQWVEDCYHSSYVGAPGDAAAWVSGNCAQRVIRGGSWVTLPPDERAASRSQNTPGERSNDIGFRVARTITP
jgi:formylglycine-generating enzyme required for sulfatase activity